MAVTCVRADDETETSGCYEDVRERYWFSVCRRRWTMMLTGHTTAADNVCWRIWSHTTSCGTDIVSQWSYERIAVFELQYSVNVNCIFSVIIIIMIVILHIIILGVKNVPITVTLSCHPLRWWFCVQMECEIVLLRWQEFATQSVAVFFDMPLRWRCQWQISVSVKARVVNWEQVDAVVGCPGMP